jgi:peptidoglycan hydrolase CwlO-like protein
VKNLLPFVVIPRAEYAKTHKSLTGAVTVIKRQQETIADLQTGLANYEKTLQGMKDYTESFLTENQERQRDLDEVRLERRKLQFKLDQIEGVVMSMGDDKTRFARRIAAILDAEVKLIPGAPELQETSADSDANPPAAD